MPRRIGIAGTLLEAPFAEALAKRAASGTVLERYRPRQLAEELRQGNLDGAFVSPWEYVSCYATHRIILAAGIVSEGASGLIALLYREHARNITRVAASADAPTERALAQIILAEKYDIRPTFHDLTGAWEAALQAADAVLVSDALARQTRQITEKIDLVDEWRDLTELPFLHGFWIVRDEHLADWSLFDPPDAAPAGVVRVAPAESDWNALREFYRMAFYLGIINDLPDLRFLVPGQELA